MLRNLRPGEFIQGTIFTCGVSDSYPNDTVLGLLITARCDTAQEKTQVYNYIPVIDVDSWILYDGLDVVAKRTIANDIAVMKKAIESAGMSSSIIDLIEHDQILSAITSAGDKQSRSIGDRFAKSAESLRVSTRAINNPTFDKPARIKYLKDNDGIYKSVIKDLLTNGLAEFHYLAKTDPSEETRGYVALLREIRFISADLGRRIANGLSYEEFSSISPETHIGLNHLGLRSNNDFAMPLSCVSSPTIEFLMQRFANLFSRIGVDDVSKDKIIAAQSWVQKIEESIA